VRWPKLVAMASICPKCGRDVPDDSVYCPHCGHGLKPSAESTQVSAGGTLLIVAAVAHLIILVVSLRALAEIYTWYPVMVAEDWIIYDQMLTVFSFTGSMFGLCAGILAQVRVRYVWNVVSAILCTLSGFGSWIISMVIPFANIQYSLLYYFLPMFATALIGTVLIFPRRAEFKQ